MDCCDCWKWTTMETADPCEREMRAFIYMSVCSDGVEKELPCEPQNTNIMKWIGKRNFVLATNESRANGQQSPL